MILSGPEWRARARAHEERVDRWIVPHLARRRRGEAHPVHDFLFTYYAHRPAQLRRWHPGYGVALADAAEYEGVKGYHPRLVEEVAQQPHPPLVEEVAQQPSRDHPDPRAPHQVSRQAVPAFLNPPDPHPPLVEEVAQQPSRNLLTVSPAYLAAQEPLIRSLHALLVATASRPPTLGCFGLHEWAMAYRTDGQPAGGAMGLRHPWPLRLGPAGTDEVVESSRIGCSHFDAFRFFTPEARPLNTLQPGRDDRTELEQPGCLHAGMDLYGKVAVRLGPLIPSELVADAFELAWDIRTLDMRAAPYDFSGLTLDPTGELWTPVPIETPEGRAEYVTMQRGFSERGAPIRQQLIEECERLLAAATV